MSVWLNFDYMSVGDKIDEAEIQLVCDWSHVDRESAEKIVKIGARLRQEYQQGDLPYGPSVGDLANWAKIVSDGNSVEKAAEETIIALTSDDMEVQEEVRSIVKRVCGGDSFERKFV